MKMSEIKSNSLNVLLEFLEVIVHNILYTKKIYPDSVYILRKKYGVTVYQIIHPEVVKYIKECLEAASFHLQKTHLRRLCVCVETDERVLERFVIELLSVTYSIERDVFLVDLEEALRTSILKLHSAQVYLEHEIHPDTTFSIHLETSNQFTSEFNENPVNEHFPWIERTSSQNIVKGDVIVPIHTVDTGLLKLQLYVEK